MIEVDGNCTLVDAITASNTDTATRNCPRGLADDTIVLAVDVTLTAANNADNGLPVIVQNLTIEGVDHTITRDSMAEYRFVSVNAPANLTVRYSTWSNGGSTTVGFEGGAFLVNGGASL